MEIRGAGPSPVAGRQPASNAKGLACMSQIRHGAHPRRSARPPMRRNHTLRHFERRSLTLPRLPQSGSASRPPSARAPSRRTVPWGSCAGWPARSWRRTRSRRARSNASPSGSSASWPRRWRRQGVGGRVRSEALVGGCRRCSAAGRLFSAPGDDEPQSERAKRRPPVPRARHRSRPIKAECPVMIALPAIFQPETRDR